MNRGVTMMATVVAGALVATGLVIFTLNTSVDTTLRAVDTQQALRQPLANREAILQAANEIPFCGSIEDLVRAYSLAGFKVFQQKKSDSLLTIKIEGPEYDKKVNAFVSWSYRPVWKVDYLLPDEKLLLAEGFFEGKPPVGNWEKIEESAPIPKSFNLLKEKVR